MDRGTMKDTVIAIDRGGLADGPEMELARQYLEAGDDALAFVLSAVAVAVAEGRVDRLAEFAERFVFDGMSFGPDGLPIAPFVLDTSRMGTDGGTAS